MNEDYNSKDKTYEFDTMDIERNKVVCAISYLGFLFFLPLLACKDSPYGKFHANQALVIFIAEAVVGAVSTVLGALPLLGWAGKIVSALGGLVCLIYAVLGIVYTLQGKAMQLPFIGAVKIIR